MDEFIEDGSGGKDGGEETKIKITKLNFLNLQSIKKVSIHKSV